MPISRRCPDFTRTVRTLIEHVARSMPEFSHIDVSRIIIVAGEARRNSRSSVRPLSFTGGRRVDSFGRKKPLVKRHGVRCLYIITLRPLFFRSSTPRQRVATILHELFHIAKAFDGTLEQSRRHRYASSGFERAFRPIERRIWLALPKALKGLFSHDGDVRIQQWLERPQTWLSHDKTSQRAVYTERQLFNGIVHMKTP